MSTQIVIDEELYQEILKTKQKIEREGCINPSYSNAIRTMLDMPHINGKGRFDTCGGSKSRKGIKIEQPDFKTHEREFEENIDIS